MATKTKIAASKEEARVLDYYRSLGRWERNAFHILLQSLAWGKFTEKADRMSWAQIARIVGLPREARRK